MVQKYRAKDGQIHIFPDDATPEEIDAATKEDVISNGQPSNQLAQISQMLGINRTPVDTIRDLAQGAISGLGKGGQTIASALTGGYAPKVNMDEITAPIGSPNKSIGGEVTKGIGSYLPYGALGGASLLGQVLAGGAYGAATGEPGQRNLFGALPSGKTGSAIESALLNALTHGAFQGIQALRPSRLLRGALSPEELQANVEATRGTPTGLGDVIGSPFLKRQYENIISKLPFSGATEKFQQAGQAVQQRGNEILSKLLGNENPENVTDQLNDALINVFKNRREIKNNLYNEFNNEADKQFLDLSLPKFSSQAKKYRDAIESTNILKFEPDMKNIFYKLANYEQPVKKIPGDEGRVSQFGETMLGEPLTTHVYPTAKEANLLKGKLNHYANLYKYDPDSDKRYLSGIFKDLSSSLKEDIKDAVEKSGNEALKSLYKTAEKNYAENFSPLLDKDIYGFISGKKDPDTITQSFIKSSRSADRSKHLAKLTQALGESRPLLAYSYFSRALDNEGNLNPAKLSTLANNLGKNQFKALVPDQIMRDQIKNYSKLYKMNVKGVNLMQNIATGQQALDIIPGLIAHAAGSMMGGGIAGLPGALAGLIAPGLAAKPLVNMMTSPAVRESLVKAMIANKPWNKNVIPALQTGVQGTINR